MRKALLACGLLALPTTLGGCVAAVAAIPMLAGGTMATSGGSDEDSSRLPVDEGASLPLPPFELSPAPEGQPTSVAAPAPTPIETTAPGLADPIDEPADAEVVSVPAPVEAASPGQGETALVEATATATALANPYNPFFNHAIAQAGLDPVDDPRSSAILATPGSLNPVMSDCAIRPPAVLVDLDPAGETLDLNQPVSPNPQLSDALAALRVRDVAVFWISGASAGDAGKLRERLLVSGLDPWGRDGLLLMRRADDRKQIRRRELSEMHCVVAIAGDAKGDFDELFDYLKNPAAAAPLDALMGDGWFLVPNPFDPEEK